MPIIHTNNYTTTLDGAITNSQTTITVNSVVNAPAVGSGSNAYLTITNGTLYEIVLATALAGNDFTVTRAQQGTTGQAFADGDTLFLSCTSYDLDSFDTPNNVTINGINVGRGTANIATNSSFGTSSLNAVTTGARTASFGYEAGILMTSGSDNAFFGYRAGQKVTTQSGNSCFGSQSGNQSSTTQQTTMMGFKAGAACSSQDSAFGYQALMAGSGDAFGYNVLNASSGSLNCAFGNSTLSGASYSGSQTCAFGYNVLPSATTGTRNTCFGHQTGYSATAGSAAITTGNDNVFIGHQASANDATANDVIAIGSGAIGEKNTGTGSGDHGACPAFGSTSHKSGFRGDGTIYPNTNGGGFWRAKINGTKYLIPLLPDASTTISDTNGNLSANNFLSGYASTATAAGTTTLTVSSVHTQVFTGTTTQNCDMPVVSTLSLGTCYTIINKSTGNVTVRSSGGNTIIVLGPNNIIVVSSNATSGTTASVWDIKYRGSVLSPICVVTLSGNQTISTSTDTKIQFDSETIDSNNNFDNATNYRFTPTVSGNYLAILHIDYTTPVDQALLTANVWKNGSLVSGGGSRTSASGTAQQITTAIAVVTMNGSTDYIEGYAYHQCGVSVDIDGPFTSLICFKVS